MGKSYKMLLKQSLKIFKTSKTRRGRRSRSTRKPLRKEDKPLNAALGMVNAVIGGYDADIVDTTDGSTIGAGLTTPSIGAHGTSFSRSSSSNTSRRMVAPPRAIVKLTNVSRNLHGIQESKQAIRIECEKRKLVQADNECKRIENEAKRLAMQEQDAKAMRDMMMTAMAKQFGNQ